jgi:hypothetical protein
MASKRGSKQAGTAERPQVVVRVFFAGQLVEETVADGPLSIYGKGAK